jgi:WD40 repeat protein
MASVRHDARPGLREVWALWGAYALVAAAVFATYARLPVRELYHVSADGRVAGAGRTVVILTFPMGLAAIPLVAVAAARARDQVLSWAAALAAVLCAFVFWPGIVDQNDLDAKWLNAVPATGVAIAVALSVVALRRHGLGPRTRVRGDTLRVAAALALVLLALPWIAADLGFFIGRWPVLGSIFFSDEWWARFGHARLHPAVHLGHHHGMDGTLLALTAIFLSRTLADLPPRLRRALGAYLAVLLVYGLANVANDFWLEQLVKRDVTSWEVPSFLIPSPNVPWLVLLVLAGVAYVLLCRRANSAKVIRERRLIWPAVVQLGTATLLVVGLLHGEETHVTPSASVNGIAFVSAPEGTSHIFVTGARDLRQLIDSDDSELAPAWSPDHGQIAFQSNRDGNWEIYVADADGSNLRRLTDDGARDGEPAWTPDGRQITFNRDGRLFSMTADGQSVHALDRRGEWPSWSSNGVSLAYDVEFGGHHGIAIDGPPGQSVGEYGSPEHRRPVWSPKRDLLAYQCLKRKRWHICLVTPGTGKEHVLTGDEADAFAPAWSPDGRRIAFISDRDGNDQLYVMNRRGDRIVRVTNGQAEKDTPSWGG